jgi:2,3-bisphosphoglycerate-dependent phosphoglycerate mutase
MTSTSHYTPDQTSFGKLILLRHAESEWNRLGKWTGLSDVHLSIKGSQDAVLIGRSLADIDLNAVYCSEQIRSVETMQILLKAAQNETAIITRDKSLNERDYGEYTGLNKWEVRDRVGGEAFRKIRRSWDYPIPGGETLKKVYARVVPFYVAYIVPDLLLGENVAVISHGNTLRALIKYIESISNTAIENLEIPFNKIIIYQINFDGRLHTMEERLIDITSTFA